ncbi:MAG TPA: hypothetical protein VF781_11885 [Solirubrobacteraceae bacterium]
MPCPALLKRPPPAAALLTTVAVAVLAGLLAAGCGAQGTGRPIPPDAIRVEVGPRPVTGPLPGGFIGLSIEYSSALAYAGEPGQLNPVFLALVRGLDRGQSPVLRFGGDTTDWTWWPVPGMARPKGIRESLTPHWLATTAALTRALDARLILGINFEADSPRIAGTEARALVQAIGAASVAGLELGNEPEAYSTLGWYSLHHTIPVFGRPPTYGFTAYLRDYSAVAGVLPPGVPVAGPASGAPDWLSGLSRFLTANPRVRMATFHRYPLHRCATPRSSIAYPTIANLLAPVASSGPATSLAAAVGAAHSHGVGFRADELNSVSCGGAAGVSDTFASALWIMDTLFNMDRVGVDGVNIHTFRSGRYAPFTFRHRAGRWSAQVRPLYYGLLMFSRAAPPGSRLLPTRHPGGPALRIWATRGRDNRLRVLLINDALDRAATIAVRLPSAAAPAELERLTAPGIRARHGLRLAGQAFASPTLTGALAGVAHATRVAPQRGRYVLRLPAASAALLTTASG